MTETENIEKEIYTEIVNPKSYLWWWVPDKERLSLRSVVEAVLAYGDMEDVRKLFLLVGRRKVAGIFFEQISGRRCNYRPQTVNFFKKVFSRMFENVLTAEQMALAERLLPELGDFYLAGGTALALQLGHRRSLDFDLASSDEIQSFDIERRLAARGFRIQAVLVATGNEFSVILNGTRVTFFYYPFDIEHEVSWDRVKITLPDVAVLAAMKAYALGRRSKWKDYVDLYFVLKLKMDLEELIGKARDIFSLQFNSKLFREQLCYFDDIDYSEAVEYISFAPTDDEIREFLVSLAVAI